ncbi:MAG: hypothetical protein ACYCX4_14795 [Bacillota bacterium]
MTRISAKQAREMGLHTGHAKGQALPKPKESDIQRQIKDYLQWHGWFVFKNHQSLGSYPGVADLTAIKRRTVWIEVKTLEGRQSDDQIKFQRDVEEHGGEYILARGIEDVEHLLRE